MADPAPRSEKSIADQKRHFDSYVDTLSRLQATIREARRNNDEAMEEEARIAINRMRTAVKAVKGEAGWAAIEDGVDELMNP